MQRLAVEEAVRWRAMNRLALTFKTMAAEKLGVRWTRHFEGWLYSRRAVCACCAGGIFPLGKEAEADVELERKLEAAVQPSTINPVTRLRWTLRWTRLVIRQSPGCKLERKLEAAVQT